MTMTFSRHNYRAADKVSHQT